MNGARRVWCAALTCAALSLTGQPGGQVRVAIPLCAPTVRAMLRLPTRVDSLLAVGASGAAAALTGSPSAAARYLPHDSLALLTRHGAAWRLALPAYITPPGLVLSASMPSALSVVLDHTILSLDPRTGDVRARISLDMQALGWPATAVSGAGGRLYVAGQPDSGMEAVVEALVVGPAGHARVAWRTRLGLFHAGLWLAPAPAGRLLVYLPGTYDAPGSMALLDERSGALRAAYAIAGPPSAADAAHNRLYRVDTSTIYALTLDRGRPVASAPGGAPLALDPARSLLAYVHGDDVVLASTRTLRPAGRVALSGVTALAATPDGATLIAGLRGGIAWIDLQGCQAAV